ncbi:hypothetical protein ACFLZX_05900 [Nanoarchaeota archaeon]
MNGLKEDFSKLKGNVLFNKWKESHKNTIFSYAFNMIEGEKLGKWQFGFYEKSSKKVTTFVVDGEVVEKVNEDEVFKEPDKEVVETNVDVVKMPILEMFDRIVEFTSKQYPNEVVVKIILILQNVEEFGNIWNITMVTKSMNTVNLKVDPVGGEIKSHKSLSLFEFKK